MPEHRLAFAVTAGDAKEPSATFLLSLNPFRRVVKDYFLVLGNYFEAIKSAPPSRIEALDMGRRALHDEGSKLLSERLHGKGGHGRPHVATAVHPDLRPALERLSGGTYRCPRLLPAAWRFKTCQIPFEGRRA